MPNADYSRILEVLRRDEALIAREAGRLFVQQLHTRRSPLQSPRVASLPDETQAILAADFRRLASVVALGLQVEEPRLVSEELQWLERHVAMRFDNVDGAPFLDPLVGSFSGACRKSLSGEDCAVITGLLADARARLTEVEPLLTETGRHPHFEGSTAQDK